MSGFADSLCRAACLAARASAIRPAAEREVGLDEVGRDGERVVTPGQAAFVDGDPLLENADHERVVAAAQGAERLDEVNLDCGSGDPGDGGEAFRLGDRPHGIVVPAARRGLDRQGAVGGPDIDDVAEFDAQLDRLAGVGVGELMPAELDRPGRDHIQRQRQHADRAAGPGRVEPPVQVGQRPGGLADPAGGQQRDHQVPRVVPERGLGFQQLERAQAGRPGLLPLSGEGERGGPGVAGQHLLFRVGQVRDRGECVGGVGHASARSPTGS